MMPRTDSFVTRRAVSRFGFLLTALAANAMAQSPPGSVPVGPMFAYPELEVAARRDSNIALVPDAQRKADTIWYVRPSVRLEAKKGDNVYDLTYRGEYGRFDSQTTDNFENHDLLGRANLNIDARNKVQLGLQYQDKVDPRGTLNLAATPTPNHYRQSGASALYTYGAQDAQGKLELNGDYTDKRYINNRDLGTALLDNNSTSYGGTFLWRVMPKTYATFNLSQTVFDYSESTVTLDSTNTSAFIGLRWEATAATSGKFQIGSLKKKFDIGGRPDFSGTSWQGGINWKPLRYSSIDFNTTRTANESTGLGNFTVNEMYQVKWTHAWTSRISSDLSGSYATDDFNNAPVAAAGGADRKDTTKNAGLKINYGVQRWLKFGAEYLYTTRDSNDNNSDYKRNQVMLFLSATL